MAQTPRPPLARDPSAVIAVTRRWIADVVIGLDLCPFARRVFESDLIRYVVTGADHEQALLRALGAELEALAAAPIAAVETTLLIHPHVLGDFLDFNNFLDPADRLLTQLGLRGVIQIVGFHPNYRFADAEPDAVENYTNRSPYPMLHLLRERSIAAVAGDAEELLQIPMRNIETLRSLGLAGIAEKLKGVNVCVPRV